MDLFKMGCWVMAIIHTALAIANGLGKKRADETAHLAWAILLVLLAQ
jgi:hypothetical protein